MSRIFGYAALLFLLPQLAFAASLSITPASGTYTVGDTIPVRVVVYSPNQSVNAVSATLAVTGAAVESISKSGSILNFWPTEPSVSAEAGTATFEGVSLSGFQGSAGTVITVMLRAEHAGHVAVSFKKGEVFANDGQGTDITESLSGASITTDVAPAPVPVPAPSAPTPVEHTVPKHTEITPQRTTPPSGTAASTTATSSMPIEMASSAPTTTSIAVASIEPDPLVPILVAVIALLLLLLIAAIFWISHLARRSRRMAKGHALGRVHARLHTEFADLKSAISSEVVALEHARSRRALSEEEDRFVVRMKLMLEKSEKVIEREVDSLV